MNVSCLSCFNCLKIFSIGTLITGIYCHLSRLVFGIDNLQRYLLTPLFEGLFSLPMIIVAALQLAFIKRIAFRNKVEKAVFYFSTFQFLVSVPVHARAFILQDNSYTSLFPSLYSVFTILLWCWFIYVFAFLKLKSQRH